MRRIATEMGRRITGCRRDMTRFLRSLGEPRPCDQLARQEIRHQQALALRRQSPLMMGVAIVAAFLNVGLHYDRIAPEWLFGWLVLALAPFPYLIKRYLSGRSHVPVDEAGRVVRNAIVAGVYLGAAWGVAGILFFDPNSVPRLFALAISLGSMAAAASGVLNTVPRTSAAFLLLSLLPFAGVFAAQGEPGHLATAGLIVLYSVILIVSAIEGYRRFIELMAVKTAARAARADLLDAVEHSSDAFGFFDTEGRPVLINERYRSLFGEGAAEIALGEDKVHKSSGGAWLKSAMRKTRRGGLVSVHTDITDLKTQEEELRRARDAAEEANRAKSLFLAMMSHELRTPLNAVIGFSELLEMKARTRNDDKDVDHCASISKAGRHLLSIINDILDLSKIEAGRYPLHEEELDVAAALESAAVMVRPQAEAGEIALTIDVDPAAGGLFADSRAVQQMIVNLLSNAVKFTPPGGRVSLSARSRSGALELEVADTGPGIPEEARAQVLRPFVQADNSLAREKSGTGLGLPLVKRLADLHGGTLALACPREGGTQATLRFPAERLLPADPAGMVKESVSEPRFMA